MTGRRALDSFIALALVAPLLVSLGYEVFQHAQWGPPGGDYAVLEIHLRDAVRFKHWLGPYSRFGWNHPGPLYYYVLAPLYALTFGSSASLYVSAATIGLASAACAIVMFFRERLALRDRVLFALTFGAAAFDLWLRKLPGDPWNPSVTVLPFAAFWVLSARVAAGRISLLPVCVFFHAFVVQTHISYLPCATAMLLVAIGCCLWQERANPVLEKRAIWRAISFSVLVLVIVWLPTLIAELGAAKSNLGAIFRYFTGAKSRPNSFEFALAYGAARLQSPILRLVPLGDEGTRVVALLLGASQYVLLAVSAAVARKRNDRFVFSSSLIALVAITICYWSCRHVGDVSSNHNYLTLWFAFVGMLSWLSIALALAPAIRTSETRTWPGQAALAAACVLLGALSLLDAQQIGARYQRIGAHSRAGKEQVVAATERVASLMQQSSAGYVLGVGEGRPWDFLAGVVLGLKKLGLAPMLEARWRFMFGGGLTYVETGSSLPSLILTSKPSSSATLLDTFGTNGFLYLRVKSEPPPARVIATATGSHGQPDWAIDGKAPDAGAPWSSPCVLQLDDASSALLLHLPGLRVGALDAVVDGDDTYVVEASEDNQSFVHVGELAPIPEQGLRKRHVELAKDGPWRSLRLSALGGDGNYAVAEVQLETPAWSLALLGSVGARDDARLAVDGKTPPKGSSWSETGAVRLEATGSSLTFLLPAAAEQEAHVAGLRVSADGNDEYTVGASYDGEAFQFVGVLPSIGKRGMQTREFYFNDGREWTQVRLSPRKGDGRFSIGEVAPIVSAGRQIDFARASSKAYLKSGWVEPSGDVHAVLAAGGHGILNVPLESGAGYGLDITLEPLSSALVNVAIHVNGEPVGRAEVKGMYTISVAVPAGLTRAENEVVVDFSSAKGTSAAPVPGLVHALSVTAAAGSPAPRDDSACL